MKMIFVVFQQEMNSKYFAVALKRYVLKHWKKPGIISIITAV